jgi:hypothetical protein
MFPLSRSDGIKKCRGDALILRTRLPPNYIDAHVPALSGMTLQWAMPENPPSASKQETMAEG